MKKWIARCWKYVRRGFKRLRLYEWTIAILAAVIVGFGILAWINAPESSIGSALDIAQPILVGIGTLSIILLWAQLRESSIWNRLLSYHQFFSEVPPSERIDALRTAFAVRLKILAPPTAYNPLSETQAKEIFTEKRLEDGQPNCRSLLQGYLNDYEQFCGAINVGLVDDEYARELRGTRVIDAYFGFAPLINLFREEYEQETRQRGGAKSIEPFTSKYYLELQLTATRWLEKRQKEFKEQDRAVSEANARAEKVRKALIQRGVPPKARNRDGD